jgi:hypothetical protein
MRVPEICAESLQTLSLRVDDEYNQHCESEGLACETKCMMSPRSSEVPL